MSEYIYNPRDSFLARCWWQGSAERIEPAGWDHAKRHLAAIWVERGSRDQRGHWDEYLQSEADGVLEKRLEPIDYLSPDQCYYELFWFGAYTQGRPRPGKRRYYEIRPADRVGSVARWLLDCTWLSSYVGIWKTSDAQGANCRPEGARLWTIDGLGPQMRCGDRQFNLQLITPAGEKIRRYESGGARFFNTSKGQHGLVAMEILSDPGHYDED